VAAGVVVRKPDGSGLSPYDLKRLQVCKCVQLCVCAGRLHHSQMWGVL
jgi:hypothetical protein